MASPGLAAQPKGLLLHFDANRAPDPQRDAGRGLRLAGAQPVLADGLQTWEFQEVPVILAWHLGPERSSAPESPTGGFDPDDLGWYRGRPRSRQQNRSLQRLDRASPQVLEPAPELPPVFTLGLWVRLFPTDPAERPPVLVLFGPEADALVVRTEGLELRGPPGGRAAATVLVPRSRWVLLFLSRTRADAALSVSGAWTSHGVQELGSLGPLPPRAALSGLGGGEAGGEGCGHLNQLALWDCALGPRDCLLLFAADAPRYGCLTIAQAEALREGRPVPRDLAQEAEFRQRLELVRSGGGEPPGVADFAHFDRPGGFQISSQDLPDIMEATAEGAAEELLLTGAVLDVEDVRDVVTALRRPGPLQRADVAGCAAVGRLGPELLERFPYARGCSLEAADCGLREDEVERLRNRTEEAAEARRAVAEARQRCEDMCAQYLARQEALEDLAAENCAGDEPPPPPPPLHHPKQWRPGVDRPARAEYEAFLSANPEGLREPREPLDDEEGESVSDYSMVDKGGRSKTVSTREYGALCIQRRRLLEEVGDAESGEDSPADGEEEVATSGVLNSHPGCRALRQRTREKRKDHVGFMLWNGAVAEQEDLDSADIAAAAQAAAQAAAAAARAEREAERRRRQRAWEMAWRERQAHQEQLAQVCRGIYDAESPERPAHVASGQIVAHFTFLCYNGVLPSEPKPEPLERFGLKRLADAPRPRPRWGPSLHEALAGGKLQIEGAKGRSFGAESLELRLRNEGAEELTVIVQHGTIFQHVDWQHRQNLLVAMDYRLVIPAGGAAEKKMHAYCMNLSCACSCGNPMSLTELYFDDEEATSSQSAVWDHFERSFGLD